MTWNEAFAVLEPLSDWPDIRVAKLRALFELSQSVREGCIVEFGTFRGLGALAMALGSRFGGSVPVFTIDDRLPKRGWAGESYGPDDECIFQHNLRQIVVNVTPIVGEVRCVAETWTEPVGLAIWDLGIRNRLPDDFRAWQRHLLPTGRFVVKDIEPPGFGRDKIAACPDWELEREYSDGFVFVYRRVLDRGGQPSGGGNRER